MKRCPECGREYDNSMMFCLDDGTELLYGPALTDGPATAILLSAATPAEAPTRNQIPSTTETALLSNTGGNPARRKNSLIAGVLGVVLVTALGVGSYVYYARGSSSQIGSIAVMPFVNDSANPDVEYLSDGMTETLISSLSRLPDLNVKARSTVFRYKGKETDTRSLGKDLNVQAILNGRVAQRGEQITLSLELVDVATENAIWSQQYVRGQSDLVSLQSEIARDVSTKLQSKLSGADTAKVEKKYTADPEAYQLYLKGRFVWNKRTPDALKQALEFYKQAVEKDPTYALAYSGIADTYVNFPSYSMALPKDSMPQAKAAALRALELDDTVAEAHAAMGLYLSDYEGNRAGAETEYRRAIELNPTYATAHQWLSTTLIRSRRFDEALEEIKRAEELDPLSPIIGVNVGDTFVYMRRNDDAIEQYKRVLILDPGFAYAQSGLAWAYYLKGMYKEALPFFKRLRS